jgi:hypothetical protein
MAVQRTVGRFPTVFITMTCNPAWPEILSACGGTDPNMMPHVRDRVFRIKYRQLMTDVMEGKVFGTPVAHVFSIEFQKRGCPHVHLVVFFTQQPPVAEYDRWTCAEIPNPDTQPRLYALVTGHMLHGPCTPDKACMANQHGVCSKHFPQPFADFTSHDEDATRVTYRRRSPENGGFTFVKNGFVFTNAHVVPYNPYLLLHFACHINVDIVTQMGVIKYLFKVCFSLSACLINFVSCTHSCCGGFVVFLSVHFQGN